MKEMNETGADLYLSTADHLNVGFHRWLNIQSARWLRFDSAPTHRLWRGEIHDNLEGLVGLYESSWNSDKSIGIQSVIDIQSDRSV